MECVELYQIVSKYNTMLVFDVNFDIFGFGYLWWYNFSDVCLKYGFFKSCFQQSAKGKMTAQTLRKQHIFSTNSILRLYLPLKPRFSNSPPLCVFFVQLIHFKGGMFPVYTIDRIHWIHWKNDRLAGSHWISEPVGFSSGQKPLWRGRDRVRDGDRKRGRKRDR